MPRIFILLSIAGVMMSCVFLLSGIFPNMSNEMIFAVMAVIGTGLVILFRK